LCRPYSPSPPMVRRRVLCSRILSSPPPGRSFRNRLADKLPHPLLADPCLFGLPMRVAIPILSGSFFPDLHRFHRAVISFSFFFTLRPVVPAAGFPIFDPSGRRGLRDPHPVSGSQDQLLKGLGFLLSAFFFRGMMTRFFAQALFANRHVYFDYAWVIFLLRAVRRLPPRSDLKSFRTTNFSPHGLSKYFCTQRTPLSMI